MIRNSAPDDGSKGKAIKIAVAVVLLVTAGVLFFLRRGGGSEGQLNTAESASTFVCPVDGATLDVTPAAFDKMLKTGEAGTKEGSAVRRSPGMYVRCPKCQKRIMMVGVRCPKDGTVFAPAAADGQPAVCPKCGGKPPE